jgi:3-hydroxyisobutyrate dehydrogenase-like beta-hydroxyacid dehydrogenase
MRAGIVGMGAMGMGIARALLERGFTVGVRDLVAAKEDEARSCGAFVARDPAHLAEQVEIVLTVVVDAAQTEEVLGAIPPQVPVVMCSTIAPSDTERLAQGRAFLDAPISGGPVRAREGRLSTMVAGDDALFDLCKPLLDAMAARVFRISSRAGDGSRMKVVNNMLAAANLAAGAEAMVMARMMGLDLAQAADVIGASSGQSWIFDDRMPRALAGDYEPRAATRVLLKDVGLFVHAARQRGLTAPMAECARELFHDAVARGLGEEDDAAMLKRYAATWGAELPPDR